MAADFPELIFFEPRILREKMGEGSAKHWPQGSAVQRRRDKYRTKVSQCGVAADQQEIRIPQELSNRGTVSTAGSEES